jgi:hypothetical protein
VEHCRVEASMEEVEEVEVVAKKPEQKTIPL